MELFDEIAAVRAPGRLIPRFGADADTPLGTVVCSVMIDGETAMGGVPSTLRAVSGRATHHVWRGPIARAELLRVELDSSVDGAVGFLWRLATWRGIGVLTFACGWPAAAPEAAFDRSRETVGEARWRSPHAVVAIGTESVEQIARRAEAHDGFPARLAGERAVDVRATDAGWAVTIAGLERHEQCQVQFVVAWGPPGSAALTSTAVAREPRSLVAAAGGS